MISAKTLSRSIAYLLLALPMFVSAARADPPIQLTVDSPNNLGNLSLLPDVDAPGPVLLDEGWTLTFRADIPGAVAYLVKGTVAGTFGSNEFIVLNDPDNCLDLRDLVAPGFHPPNPGCGLQDEDILMVHTDRNDDQNISDSCDPATIEQLNNAGFSYKNLLLVQPTPPGVAAYVAPSFIGPYTGRMPGASSPEVDCYGYGQDDDLPGLVIMADIGGARFYTGDFVHIPGSIRNMAGLLSNVTVELKDASDRTSVVASMIVRRGFFNQLVAYDADIDTSKPEYTGVDYLRRLDGGPIEARSYTGVRPPPGAGIQTAIALANETPHSLVQVRAVLIDGRAPDIIKDANADGRFTAADLTAAGRRLLSNEIALWVRVAGRSRLDDDSFDYLSGCPVPGPSNYSPTTMFYSDLDGNHRSGPLCSTGSSGSTVRIPR